MTNFRRDAVVKRRKGHPIDIIDEVLRPLLGSMKATETALTIWHELRKRNGRMISPLPWKADGYVAEDVEGKTIVDCDFADVEPDEGIANAGFIAHAANCHDDLLSALEAVVAAWKTSGDLFAAMKKAISAIEKAHAP